MTQGPFTKHGGEMWTSDKLISQRQRSLLQQTTMYIYQQFHHDTAKNTTKVILRLSNIFAPPYSEYKHSLTFRIWMEATAMS